jgi:hypothetical protein
MDPIRTKDLRQLATSSEPLCVSIFLPTSRAGAETRQNRTRLKHLVDEAQTRITRMGVPEAAASGLLQPARDLLVDAGFWGHMSEGLALFVAAETFRCWRLRHPVREQLTVGRHFALRPLIPLLLLEGSFFVLALSINQVRLLEVGRDGVRRIDLGAVPGNMEEALGNAAFQADLQMHGGGPSGHEGSTFHGGEPDEEHFKKDLATYFRRVAEGVAMLLAGRSEPIVLATDKAHFPLFRRVVLDKRLLAKGVTGNPDYLTDEELCARAREVVEPWWRSETNAELARFRELVGAGRGLASPGEILPAAQEGRIEVLLVSEGADVQGTFDPENGLVEVHAQHEPGDDDLLDRAVALTLANAGRVFAMPAAEAAAGTGAAAILRY